MREHLAVFGIAAILIFVACIFGVILGQKHIFKSQGMAVIYYMMLSAAALVMLYAAAVLIWWGYTR